MTSGQVQIIFGSGPIILIILNRVNILMACKSIHDKATKDTAYLKIIRICFLFFLKHVWHLKKLSSIIFQTKGHWSVWVIAKGSRSENSNANIVLGLFNLLCSPAISTALLVTQHNKYFYCHIYYPWLKWIEIFESYEKIRKQKHCMRLKSLIQCVAGFESLHEVSLSKHTPPLLSSVWLCCLAGTILEIFHQVEAI